MKRVLSLVLAAIMVVSIFAGLQIYSSALEPTGECGGSVNWSFDESTGTLTISGEGDMYYRAVNPSWDEASPFYNNDAIKSVIIENGVNNIGGGAFSTCTGLTSITIPNSVKSIESYAFYGCTALTSITIPDSVTSIGDGAFSKCSNLTSITIPESVTAIYEYAFDDCSSLTEIIIPESVTFLDQCVFYGCTSLTSITIPASLTYIGWGEFSGCSGLKSITIPDSVTSIGEDAFYACSSLKDVYYAGSIVDWKKINIDSGNDDLTNANIHYAISHQHKYNSGVITKKPTCTTAGVKTFTCECGDYYTEPVAKLDHNYVAKVVKAKSNALGYTLHTCSRCKGSYKNAFKAPTGKPSGLKCAARTAAAMKFTWRKTAGVTGYQVQLINAKGKNAALKALKGNAYTFTKLASAHSYKARVRFYIKAPNGKNYFGKWSTLVLSPTLPKPARLIKLTPGNKSFTAQWKRVACTGYQLQYTDRYDGLFRKAKTVNIKNAKTFKYTVKKLAEKKSYLVRIRTFKTAGGKNYYSEWNDNVWFDFLSVYIPDHTISYIKYIPKKPIKVKEKVGKRVWYYAYDDKLAKNGDKLEVHYKSGVTKKYTFKYYTSVTNGEGGLGYGLFDSKGKELKTRYPEDFYIDEWTSQNKKPWKPGAKNYITVCFYGVKTKVPVTIVKRK